MNIKRLKDKNILHSEDKEIFQEEFKFEYK